MRTRGFALALGVALAAPVVGRAAGDGTLTVAVSGLRSSEGQVILAIYNGADGYPLELNKAMLLKRVPVTNGGPTISFDGLPYGPYAAAAIHDENANNTLDTNWIGLPKEGVASSNNAHGHFGPPAFADAAFSFAAGAEALPMKMAYLF